MRRFIAVALASVSMLQGVPLFAMPPAPAIGGLSAGGQTPASSGTIEGIAQTSTGQVLSRVTVRLRNLDSGQVTATTTSNGQGAFSFTRVAPANYVIELVDSKTGVIVGTSAAMAVSAGATSTAAVAATAAAVQGAAAGGAAAGGAAAGGAAAAGAAAGGAAAAGAGIGISTALVVTSLAAVAGIAGVVAVASKDNPSPSN